MARQHGASITFLHAIEPLGPTAQSLVRNIVPEDQLQQLHAEGLAKVRAEIDRRVKDFCQSELESAAAGEQLVTDVRIIDGHPADVIAGNANNFRDGYRENVRSYARELEMRLGAGSPASP